MAVADVSEPAVWRKNIVALPVISHEDIKKITEMETRTPKCTTSKGYKFFWDSYIHNVEVLPCLDRTQVRANCYRSMRKNDKPHQLRLTVLSSDPIKIKDNSCSCTAGKGFCQHQVALLYQLSHYQALNLTKIPEITSSTSAPQKWHIPPRTHCFVARPLTDITAAKPKTPIQSDEVQDKRQQREVGIRSHLYNPINVPLQNLNIVEQLLPTLSSHSKPVQWLQLWSRQEEICLVDSNYGLVPKGSLLSYQERPVSSGTSTRQEALPAFDLPTFSTSVSREFSPHELSFLESLQVSPAESQQYEEDTRDQSLCPEWHNLRKLRLTASNFKSVTGRRGNFEILAKNMIAGRKVQTAAMKHGLQYEQTGVDKYRTEHGLDTYKVGFIINPSAPHLGCSPDRRVFDADETPQWGLLEVKCPTKPSVYQLQYLKATEHGLELRRSHTYYEQCMGQMGLTGANWCDFFVYCEDDFHCQRITYDHNMFMSMKVKLDEFYYQYILPYATACRDKK